MRRTCPIQAAQAPRQARGDTPAGGNKGVAADARGRPREHPQEQKGDDPVGTRYGNLEVLREWRVPYPRPGKPNGTIPMCEAKCLLCGSVKEYRLAHLRRGHTTSCGCKNRLPDLTGKRFGYLTVLQRDETKKTVNYVCRCDCGKEVSVRASYLVSGSSVSCGCKRRGRMLERELVGKRFGRLTVVERTNATGKAAAKNILYRCICDCGKERLATGTALKRGQAVSCGCAKIDAVKGAQRRLHLGDVEHSNVYMLTRKMTKNNKAGRKGVFWNSRKKKWGVSIGANREKKTIGLYSNLSDAIAVREEAEEKYHKPLIEEARAQMKIDEEKHE